MEKGGSAMKKLLAGTVLLGIVCFAPLPTVAQIYDDVPLAPPTDAPPPYDFEAPPDMVPLPYADDVYVAPYVDIDLFFWNGLWWRLWQDRWYSSYYYDRGWVYYASVPRFYYNLGPGWRRHYRNYAWYRNPWYYNRTYRHRPLRNWQGWHNDNHRERVQTWSSHTYKSRTRFPTKEPRLQTFQRYHPGMESQYYQQKWQHQQRQPQLRRNYQTGVERQRISGVQQPRFQIQQPRLRNQAGQQMRERPRIQQRMYSRPQ